MNAPDRLDRRRFVQGALAAGASLAIGDAALAESPAAPSSRPAPGHDAPDVTRALPQQKRTFKLAYAPHFGMFAQHGGADLVSQLEFMASEGFTAFEDNGMKGRSVADQERIGNALSRLGMRMGVFVAHTIDWSEPGLPSGRKEKVDRFLTEVRESIDVAKRVNAKWVTVVPGRIDERRDMAYQTSSLIDTLRMAAAILEPHGIVMVLEMLNTRRDHPGQFLTHTAQGHAICTAVDSPSCKLLYDIYHQQITEGNLIPNIDLAWNQIGYVQVGDNPGRNEPGTGEINYRNVFRHLHAKKFTGIVGMEHGNSIRGARTASDDERRATDRRGERAVIDAYVAADNF